MRAGKEGERTLGKDVRSDGGNQCINAASESLDSLSPCLAESVLAFGREEVQGREQVCPGGDGALLAGRVADERDRERVQRRGHRTQRCWEQRDQDHDGLDRGRLDLVGASVS